MQFNNILLTGINGQVGYELQSSLATLGKVHALDRSQLDLTNPDQIRSVVRSIKPDLIVNPAAYTAVDKAETEAELAYAINATAPQIMAEEASKLGAFMLHYSTDYVYDGSKLSPYVESDSINPLSVYGKSKLAGEEAIRASGVSHIILRTSWVYGARGKNFLKTMIRLATERDQLKVVADQVGAPTTSNAIAAATRQLLQNYKTDNDGVYHFTCTGSTSWHGFAQAILEEFDLLASEKGWPPLKVHASDIIPITTADYPTPAARPANSRLDCSLLKQKLGVALPDWRVALRQVIQELEVSST